ncbi:hypothetical protein WR25_12092 [Diploscapter pachys]|uniref:Receptor ligand binding region domain-containing protein n=1 Tax=Diploscapter pachys TaxID=2018661 RepID=A0A2A2JCL4_9BILA|nr:hypothetical protein WR25_12092 [Diploscapter pachys]
MGLFIPFISCCICPLHSQSSLRNIRLMLTLSFLLGLTNLTLTYPSKVIIKSFTCENEEAKIATKALRYAVDEINSRDALPFRLSFDHHDIEPGASEAWSLITTVCNELKEGGMTLISIDGGRGYEAIRGLADALEMPLISIAPPTYQIDNTNFFGIAIRPSTAEILADFIIHKGWTEIIMFTDGDYSGIPMPSLWHHLYKKTNQSVSAHMVELPAEMDQFDEFLKQFHIRRFNETHAFHSRQIQQAQEDTNDLKNQCKDVIIPKFNRIIIDTTSPSRMQKLLSAIRSAQFSQAYYHYVVGNFDFSPYDVEMFHQGNINISGFQLINRETRGYWNLRKHLKKGRQMTTDASAGDDLDAHSALAHDAILVAYHGFARCLAANDSLFHGTFRHGRFHNRGYPGYKILP